MAKQFGKWEVIESFDQGGQGWIYFVTEEAGDPNKKFVLKRLKNPKRLDRFRTEIESLQKLDHPGIVKLVSGAKVAPLEP